MDLKICIMIKYEWNFGWVRLRVLMFLKIVWFVLYNINGRINVICIKVILVFLLCMVFWENIIKKVFCGWYECIIFCVLLLL